MTGISIFSTYKTYTDANTFVLRWNRMIDINRNGYDSEIWEMEMIRVIIQTDIELMKRLAIIPRIWASTETKHTCHTSHKHQLSWNLKMDAAFILMLVKTQEQEGQRRWRNETRDRDWMVQHNSSTSSKTLFTIAVLTD